MQKRNTSIFSEWLRAFSDIFISFVIAIYGCIDCVGKLEEILMYVNCEGHNSFF